MTSPRGTSRSLLAACGALLGACGGGATGSVDATATIDGATPAADAPVDAMAPADAAPDAACVPAHLLYLNYGGGTYQPGNEDARTHRSSLVTGPMTAPAWPGTDAAELTACVRAALAAYDITVVDADPGAVVHQEIVFTTSATLVGLPSGVPSASPFDCFGYPNGIGFVFHAEPARTCADALFVVGGLQGLEPVTECADYVSTCAAADQSFVDAAMPCDGGACRCGGTTSNHGAKILAALGPHC